MVNVHHFLFFKRIMEMYFFKNNYKKKKNSKIQRLYLLFWATFHLKLHFATLGQEAKQPFQIDRMILVLCGPYCTIQLLYFVPEFTLHYKL